MTKVQHIKTLVDELPADDRAAMIADLNAIFDLNGNEKHGLVPLPKWLKDFEMT